MYASRRTTRTARILTGVAVLGGVVAGAAAGTVPAGAAPLTTTPAAAVAYGQVHPNGWATVASCTGVDGSVTFNPGLAKRAHAQSASLGATLSGCSINGTAVGGTGTLTAALTGAGSVTSQAMSGSFVISWPAGSGLNPTTGSLSINGPTSNVLAFAGHGTGGAYQGAAVNTAVFLSGHTGLGTAKHRITNETFIATQPLNVMQNLG